MNTSFFGLKTSLRRPAHTLLASALLAAAMVASPARAYTAFEYEEEVVAATDLAELEYAFWACDHAATTRGVDDGQAIQCGSITEELKMKRFGGSFEQLLDWWNANKASQHAMFERVADDQAVLEQSVSFEVRFPESI